MAFQSILFDDISDSRNADNAEMPEYFLDLSLDYIVNAITANKREYNLSPFFYVPLKSISAITYRHEVMRDLERGKVLEHIKTFARKLRVMREYLDQADKLYYRYQQERWFLDAVEIYCDAVQGLLHDLTDADLESRGFLAFREYLAHYVKSQRFRSLLTETRKLQAELSSVQYCLLIKGNQIKVRRYDHETDYSAEIEETFEKFKQGVAKNYLEELPTWPEMNHVEAGVLDFVARLYPDIFQALDDYCRLNTGYFDETLRVFDREIQFYVAYLEFIAQLKRAGLKFCYPRISDTDKHVYNYEGFDLALANKLLFDNSPIVPNDFFLKDNERIFVVSGPNQGGKTTFARTFGQLHYLAAIGCPVPGREAQLFLFDAIYTHFEREETITDLHGKLADDLIRIRRILDQATPNSIVIINEIFSSTALRDSIFLGTKIMERLIQLDLLCVFVTFVVELAALSEKTVSVVSTVVPENPALRTYKLVRRTADGLAYALFIAEKYRLTYECVKERIKA